MHRRARGAGRSGKSFRRRSAQACARSHPCRAGAEPQPDHPMHPSDHPASLLASHAERAGTTFLTGFEPSWLLCCLQTPWRPLLLPSGTGPPVRARCVVQPARPCEGTVLLFVSPLRLAGPYPGALWVTSSRLPLPKGERPEASSVQLLHSAGAMATPRSASQLGKHKSLCP